MRFVIYGAGAIGALVGARVSAHGHDTVLIARGAHKAAIETRGLRVRSPLAELVLPVPVVGHPRDVEFSEDSIVLVATKSQDTLDALQSLTAVAPPTVPVVLLQNGVENERVALRLFENVYGGYVMVPAVHLEPGEVFGFSAPLDGVVDIGRYPSGIDEHVSALADALTSSGFDSRARTDIMRWKYAKLIANLANAANAVCGPGTRWSRLGTMVCQEGEACLRAAGIDLVPEAEDKERWQASVRIQRVGDQDYPGGSTWQSLRRGTGSVESDYLNGEIVLLGRLHGFPTPVNGLLMCLADEMALEGTPPGSVPAEEVLARLGA